MNKHIRNFCIIAHIDHGKSTLADRFLEITHTVDPRNMQPQYLDRLELERERGITIKMAPVRMLYHPHRGTTQTDTRNDAERLLYENITYQIRGAVFNVRKKIGFGHKESIYQRALEEEFTEKGLNFTKEKVIDVTYNDKKIGVYRPDFLIENKVIIEIKSLPFIGKAEEQQVWNYLKGSSYRLALLVNFAPNDLQIRRIVYDTVRDIPRASASSQRSSAEIEYILNLIDTPGHADFSYEVSRALVAVEGAILLVDATQGIQAQTLVNLRMAKKAGLRIIGALNKVDLLRTRIHADYTQTDADWKKFLQKLPITQELASLIDCSLEEIHFISGKTGEGVYGLLEAVVEHIPSPRPLSVLRGSASSQRQSALVFDSLYDSHKGVIAFVRVFSGAYKFNQETKLFARDVKFKIKEVGYFNPDFSAASSLDDGMIGYIATGIKDPDALRIGDTIGDVALVGYSEPRPVVFVSLYPTDASEYAELRLMLQELKLNDSSLSFESDFNEVLGRGFKCGFLGQLHFEIVVGRLEREFNVETVSTFPSVAYSIRTSASEEMLTIENAEELPENVIEIREPMITLEIICPGNFLGSVLQLKEYFRMEDIQIDNLEERVLIHAKMPLGKLMSDFDGQLKSISEGMASFSYALAGYQPADMEKVEILVAGEPVAGLTRLMYKNELDRESRKMLERLKEFLPRQQFSQALQARAGGRIIARETIPAMRKDVTGALYGGDRSRKMKLWKKQKKGKKKLKEMGRVTIAASVFKELLKR